MEQIRSFIAIELPDELKLKLGQLEAQLKSGQQLRVKWIDPNSIHLTLKFLGDIGEERVADVVAAVERVTGRADPFTLRTSGVGGFPNREQARVVWVGLTGDLEALGALQKAVEGALSGLGFPAERRSYFPHLTLGRVRRAPVTLPPNVSGFAPVSFRVACVTTIRSDLGAQGAVHTPLGYGALRASRASGYGP